MEHEINDLPLSTDLLNYYRQRIAKSELEFKDAIDRLSDIKIAHETYHDISRNLVQKDNELDQIKKALSESQVSVFEERKHLLRVIAENDELKVREIQDRKKIQYLLALSGSSTEDGTTYFRNRVPTNIIQTPNATNDGKKDDDYDGPSIQVESSKLKTQITEEKDIDIQSLKLKLSALQTQIDEQSTNYEAYTKQLKNENSVQLNDLGKQNDRLKVQLEALLTENEKLRHISRENIKELLHNKKEFKVRERSIIEEKSSLREEKRFLVSKVANLEQQYRNVEKAVETKYLKNQDQVMEGLKEVITRINGENKTLKLKIEELQIKYQKASEVVRKRLEIISTNYLNLKKRRHFEIEGFTNDIISLRKQLKTLERTILKYAPLEDKEFALLNMARQTGMKVEALSGSLKDIKAKMFGIENDLETNRF